ncbi:putative DNA repair protein YkoV [Candidatus Rubidus massiliensis]|nr:putative DNA repair protein YkoV [Candidatus Rubidus massiliensis]
MRSIWSGSLSFGLINIPIRLYSGTQEHTLNFDMLHKKDLSPVRYAKVCKEEEKEIPYNEIVKGYEYQKGEYIVIDEKDFQDAFPQKTKLIEILSFTNEVDIDSVFYEKPYFLEPDKGADKAYVLLKEALSHTKKVAIARFIMKNREHIAAIKPYEKGNILILNQLRYFSEIRQSKELKIPDAEISKKEMDMAIKLIEQLEAPFTPQEYKDPYIEDLEKVIDQKIKGIKPSKKATPKAKGKVHDIMSLLKASLETKKQPKKKAG